MIDCVWLSQLWLSFACFALSLSLGGGGEECVSLIAKYLVPRPLLVACQFSYPLCPFLRKVKPQESSHARDSAGSSTVQGVYSVAEHDHLGSPESYDISLF